MTETATIEAPTTAGLTIDEMPWQDVELPPTDLPYDDGDKMESPWHYGNATILVASYVAANRDKRHTFYMGANMFIYYSMSQARNQDFKGPDVFLVKDVDGLRKRLSWMVWDEDGRYPDVIIELMSKSTRKNDLGKKKTLYERTFRTAEYFCVDPEVETLKGWRHTGVNGYAPIEPDERGWLWSKELGYWLGPWHGPFMTEEHTWLRYYTPDGELVLLDDEYERQRADEACEEADEALQRAATAEERATTAEERAATAEERATTAEERAATAEERAARLAELLRQHGISPDNGADGAG